MKKNKVKMYGSVANKSENEPKKKKRTGLIVGIVSLILIIAAVVGILIYTFIFARKTIDLSECLKIEYDGYNGYATVSIELDEKKLKQQIDDSSIAKKFAEKAELEIDSSTNLSNGDEIKLKVSISDSFLENNKLKLKEEKITIQVAGIEDFSNLDLSKYVKLEYTGFNKNASAEVKLDTSLQDVLGKDDYQDFVKQAKFTIENNEGLENGKDVNINVDISKTWLQEHGLTLKSNTIKVEVSGLEEAKEIDVFADMKVSISGMSPAINITITNESTDEFIKTVKFKASKTSGISNGETIKIEAVSWDTDMANKKKYVLKEKTTEYKIDNQPAYIFKTSEITDDIKSQIKNSFIEKAKSKASEINWYSGEGDNQNAKHQIRNNTDYKYVTVDNYDQDLKLENAELVSLYLLTKKEDLNSGATNKIVGIVKMSYVSSKSGTTYNWYVTVDASNFSTKKDGTISDNAVYDVSLDSGKDQESAYEKWINSKKNNYNVDSIAL